MARRGRDRRAARRTASRAPRRRLLVVCEGKRTEPDYIRGFEREVRNAAVQVEIAKERGDPRRVVEIAKEQNDQAETDAKREQDSFLRFDEVWCVFDRDEHERFDQACDMARRNGFNLAVSNPCVELWLLLHFQRNPGAQDRYAVQELLRQHLPKYNKRLAFEDVRDGRTQAEKEARRLDKDAESMGEPMRNPTTGFYRLLAAIASEPT